MQKLTLRMKAELVQDAKEYAARNGKSLSQLVADYLDFLTREAGVESELPPVTSHLKGLLKDRASTVSENDYKL